MIDSWRSGRTGCADELPTTGGTKVANVSGDRRLVRPHHATLLATMLALASTGTLSGCGSPGHPRVEADRHSPPGSSAAPSEQCAPLTDATAQSHLRQLASRVGQIKEPTGGGRYAHIRSLVWFRDTTSPVPDPPPQMLEEQTWWASDRSGRREIRTLPSLSLDALQTSGWLTSFAAVPPRSVRYEPGELAIPVPDPSEEPEKLARQLAAQDPVENGPHAVLSAASEMYRYHTLRPRQRSSLLQVVADSTALGICRSASDPLGRSGLAITTGDEGKNRHVLTVDENSGRALSYQLSAREVPRHSAIREPGVTYSLIFLSSDRVTTAGSAISDNPTADASQSLPDRRHR